VRAPAARGFLRLPRAATVALCYLLLVQAALAPLTRSRSDVQASGQGFAVICVSGDEAGPTHPAPGAHDDDDCCLPCAGPGAAALAVRPVAVAPPSSPGRATAFDVAAPCRGPPTVDLGSRPTRAPPLSLV
jgi:hypothetical protein